MKDQFIWCGFAFLFGGGIALAIPQTAAAFLLIIGVVLLAIGFYLSPRES
jgi:hypothetical protein